MNVVKHKCGLTELDRRTGKCGIYYPILAALKNLKSVCRGPDRGVSGKSEHEDDQLNYYGEDEDPYSADEAAPEVAEPEIIYYGSADEDPDEDAPEVAEPEIIVDRLYRRFDRTSLRTHFFKIIFII